MKSFWLIGAACLFSAVAGSRAEEPSTKHDATVPNRAPLETTPFVHLPMGSVRAQGWLQRQLELQKEGLTGSAEKLYDALADDSGWLGGKGEAWEKTPYYVKGLVALAYTLDDRQLQQRAQRWIDWAIQSQRPDGFFGPSSNDDWWPRMVVLFYLRDYYEASGDPRVIPFLLKYFRFQLQELPARPLNEWGRARAGDNIDVVLWTYNVTGEPFLLDLAKLLHAQSLPWTSVFTNNEFYGHYPEFHTHHIVNVNQAMKTPPVVWQFTHDPADRAALGAGMAHLERQYGRIDGQISGTEQLSGLASTDGVEFCADIERFISDAIAIDILGDAAIGDSLEKVAYNSMPAHTSARMLQMTYYQLPNQIACTFGGHGFHEDYGNGNMPGPYSGFPCCCYNWHSGWPKFVQSMWSATSDGGLALIAYGPNEVRSIVADGVPITITQETDYPFEETVRLKVQPQRAAKFPLVLRIPSWCKTPTASVNGKSIDKLKPGTFQRVEREWSAAGDIIEIKLPMEVRTSTWTNGSVGLERGPLAFSLRIKEDWKRVHDYQGDFDEYEVRPLSAWNYALQINREAPQVQVKTSRVSDVPFDTDAPPVVLTLPARRVPSWGVRASQAKITLGKAKHNWNPIGEATATPLRPAATHHLRVEAKGSSIRVFIDDLDKPLVERDDSTFSAGDVGLRAYDAAATFQNIRLDGKPLVGQPAMHGGKWKSKDGTYSVEPSKDAKAVFTKQGGLKDFTFEADVTVGSSGDAGLIFRAGNLGDALDAYDGYYVGLSTKAQSIDAQEPPTGPIQSDQPLENIELIPFGSERLRVSYFPVLGS